MSTEPVADVLTGPQRIRMHERIQQAVGLINEAEDDLPQSDPIKVELHDIARRVWVLGYELLGDMADTGERMGPAEVARCRECGCTDEAACDGGCSWVEADLCSACRSKWVEV